METSSDMKYIILSSNSVQLIKKLLKRELELKDNVKNENFLFGAKSEMATSTNLVFSSFQTKRRGKPNPFLTI